MVLHPICAGSEGVKQRLPGGVDAFTKCGLTFHVRAVRAGFRMLRTALKEGVGAVSSTGDVVSSRRLLPLNSPVSSCRPTKGSCKIIKTLVQAAGERAQVNDARCTIAGACGPIAEHPLHGQRRVGHGARRTPYDRRCRKYSHR
jgi:hypothetical protein